LARALNRRTFLKRAGQATFGVVATLAAGHSLADRAAAMKNPSGGPSTDPLVPNCAPPGPYCNTGGGNLSGCHGAHCFQHLSSGVVVQCHVYYAFYAGRARNGREEHAILGTGSGKSRNVPHAKVCGGSRG